MRFILLVAVIAAALGCQPKQEQLPPQISALVAKGDQKSLHEVGVAYESGDGVQVNLVEAAKWYLEAASKGNIHSHYRIWSLWEDFSKPGMEPPFDLDQFETSRKAAIAGYEKLTATNPDSEAFYRLGLLYDPGVGIDGVEAKLSGRYLNRAADMGHQEAKELLKFIRETQLGK